MLSNKSVFHNSRKPHRVAKVDILLETLYPHPGHGERGRYGRILVYLDGPKLLPGSIRSSNPLQNQAWQ